MVHPSSVYIDLTDPLNSLGAINQFDKSDAFDKSHESVTLLSPICGLHIFKGT